MEPTGDGAQNTSFKQQKKGAGKKSTGFSGGVRQKLAGVPAYQESKAKGKQQNLPQNNPENQNPEGHGNIKSKREGAAQERHGMVPSTAPETENTGGKLDHRDRGEKDVDGQRSHKTGSYGGSVQR